jgi:predicted DNA-binding protein (MmcQ/YjbR family)
MARAGKKQRGPAKGLPGGSKALARIRRLCLALPESSEKIAWGAPTFRVRGKLFVMFVNNHHNDGRIAIWCNAPAGAQQAFASSDPEHFFVPPYVGCNGWLGIRLDKGLDWSVIAEMVKEAHRETAPDLA